MGSHGPYPSSETKGKIKEEKDKLDLNQYSTLTEAGTWPELYRKYGQRILSCGEWQKELCHRVKSNENPHLARDFYRDRVWTGSVLNYRDNKLEWDVKLHEGILYKKILDPYDVIDEVGRSFDLECGIPTTSTRIGNLTKRYQKFLQRLFMSPVSRIDEFADSNFWVLTKPQGRMIILRGGSYSERDDIFVVSMFTSTRSARIKY